MLAEAADHLTEQASMVVEVGNSQVHVEALYPEVDFTWLEFERGGHGVFLLAAAQCREHQALSAAVWSPDHLRSPVAAAFLYRGLPVFTELALHERLLKALDTLASRRPPRTRPPPWVRPWRP